MRVFLFASMLILVLSLVSCGGKAISGNGIVTIQDREIKGFKGISVKGAYDVYLKKGVIESIVLEADENLMSIIKTKVLPRLWVSKVGVLCWGAFLHIALEPDLCCFVSQVNFLPKHTKLIMIWNMERIHLRYIKIQ